MYPALFWLRSPFVTAANSEPVRSFRPAMESLRFQTAQLSAGFLTPTVGYALKVKKKGEAGGRSWYLHIHELFNNTEQDLEACCLLLLLPFRLARES